MINRMTLPKMVGTYALLLMYYGFFLIPILWLVLQSFKTNAAIFSGSLIPRWNDLTLSSYTDIWQSASGSIEIFLKNSTIIAASVTAVSLVISTLAAYGLSKYRIWGRRGLLIVLLTSQMFPGVLILVPFYTLILDFHLSNTYVGIILAHSILALPFCVWMLKSYMDAVPQALIEASLVDGCTKLSALMRVVLPTSLPGLAVAAFFAFIVSWGDYLFVSVISSGNSTATMPMYIYQISQSLISQWGQIAAGTVIIIIPVVILFALVQRWLVEGLFSGAVKG
jgi:multiple sugar transport system permease protein/arabinogalactan oligomer/maltooligosaccharide transport system permease protein